MAAGWYQREFEATGISFTSVANLRGEPRAAASPVDGGVGVGHLFATAAQRRGDDAVPGAVGVSIGGYVDRVLRRVARSRRRLADLLLHARELRRRGGRRSGVRRAGRSGSRRPHERQPTPDLRRRLVRGSADRRVRSLHRWSTSTRPGSESTAESSIRGTAGAMRGAARPVHLDAGVAAHRLGSLRLSRPSRSTPSPTRSHFSRLWFAWQVLPERSTSARLDKTPGRSCPTDVPTR